MAEIAFQDGRWIWISQPVPREVRNSSRLHVIPVVQVVPNEALVSSNSDLVELLRAVAESGELQIDCDCPDRFLFRYAEFLGLLHREVPRITFTALAHWTRHPAWEALEENAVEVLPMFYDLYPDPPRLNRLRRKNQLWGKFQAANRHPPPVVLQTGKLRSLTLENGTPRLVNVS